MSDVLNPDQFEQLQLPGFEDEPKPVLYDQDADTTHPGPPSALGSMSIGDFLAIGKRWRAALDQENITVLRKVSKGLVKGGYSMKKPDLIDAILYAAADVADVLDIEQLIEEAKA